MEGITCELKDGATCKFQLNDVERCVSDQPVESGFKGKGYYLRVIASNRPISIERGAGREAYTTTTNTNTTTTTTITTTTFKDYPRNSVGTKNCFLE
ncbi:hypothetical protein M0804_003873 [Polistes exclamans]|nr:hypothetical protein M0804_003873 [Polistes exclamans]